MKCYLWRKTLKCFLNKPAKITEEQWTGIAKTVSKSCDSKSCPSSCCWAGKNVTGLSRSFGLKNNTELPVANIFELANDISNVQAHRQKYQNIQDTDVLKVKAANTEVNFPEKLIKALILGYRFTSISSNSWKEELINNSMSCIENRYKERIVTLSCKSIVSTSCRPVANTEFRK